ncbi:hypothetical protein R9C00_14940 [Flammeovirgaceae bacterium SG7u.111]|nr:hypothetical protein [Flammeovirgaceae bacterium SG7u.132]WPO32997.1 hypothetical protein R9C00_14940 [Flammeovirgaceae bacterium SG7u.111]
MENFNARLSSITKLNFGKWSMIFLMALLIGGTSCSSNSYAKKSKKENKHLFSVNGRKVNQSKWSVMDKHADCPTGRRREKY